MLITKETSFYKLIVGFLAVVVLLYLGKTLFIPLLFAFWIAVALFPVCNWLEKKKFPPVLAIGTSLVLLLVLLSSIAILFFNEIRSLFTEWPELKDKLLGLNERVSDYISLHFNISHEEQQDWLQKIMLNSFASVLPLLRQALLASSISVVMLVLVPFYTVLILANRQRLVAFIYSLFPRGQHERVSEVIHTTVPTYYNFIKGMLLVYLAVGILNSIGLWIVGIPRPFLFGFTASILTFIPYVGIMIGASLPMAVSWIAFNSIYYPVGVVVVFTIVQYLEANLIFPLAVSNRLKINVLSSMIAIIGGGILWGVSGMILFIPFLGMLKLVAEKVEVMKPLAIILGSEKEKKKAPSVKEHLRKS